jgi:Tol biopolymer transport system component
MAKAVIVLVTTLFIVSCQQQHYHFKGETHLRNLRMLTSSGENAEAYFSFDESKLIYQSKHGSYACDQIFSMSLDGLNKHLLSTGNGKTTCAYFFPDNEHYIYASTHGADSACPPPPDYSKGYVWNVYSNFDLYTASINDITPSLLQPAPGYDAEATISPQGDKIVFTSQRNGDLDIFTMNLDGSNLRQLTNELGYDGGPFFSWDGTKIVYRAYHPNTNQEKERYQALLANEMIEPGNFQIWIMNADGLNKRQVTHNKFANFAPFFHPDNKRIIFSSNLNSPNSRHSDFNLWMVDEDGSRLEQITFFKEFDGFPMFTRDGRYLVFASNRFNYQPRETNIFLAEWVN